MDVDLGKKWIEIQYELPYHQMILSFNDDSGGELFEEWWFKTGRFSFNEHCEKES